MMKANNKDAMTLEEYGNKLINEDLEQLVESNPYLAFIVLLAVIEFIARCRKKLKNFHNSKDTKKRYVEAINNINAFKAYKQLNYQDSNKLYTLLRCGLLHSTIPDNGITLSSEENDLPNNIVGCISLYNDVKQAWTEIKQDTSVLSYLQNHKGLVIGNR